MRILKNKNRYVILSTTLFQVLIISIFTLLINTSVTLNNLKKSIPVFNFFIAVTTVLMFISVKKLRYSEKKEAEFELMKSNMENVEELISLINTQKHNYITHIQAIGALLYLEEYEELSRYVKGISKEYSFTSEVIRLGHPALTAIINTKREIARKKGIFFHIKCEKKVDNIVMESWDLCNLLDNVIENAIEAALMAEDKKWIKLIVGYHNESFIFEIENKGHIEEDIIKRLFKLGTTSKDSPGRGYGLYISKKIVDNHGGTIDIKNTGHGSVICTIKLPREADNYDKKAV